MILAFSNQEKWAIEIKRSSSLSLSKGFHQDCVDIKPQRLYVVFSGSDRFSMEEDIKALSLYDLVDEVMQNR